MPPSLPVQLIIRLPYNRPDPTKQPVSEPPRITWNAEKEALLWEVIARSRMSENSGTDWQGLSAHLGVPLPYLLYRAQARYEQDLRGLQFIGGATAPTPTAVVRPSDEENLLSPHRVPLSTGTSGPSPKLHTRPLPVRQGSYDTSPTRLKHSGGASSTATVRQRVSAAAKSQSVKPPSPVNSDSESDDSEEEKAEEEERRREEQELVANKLKALEKMMSSDMMGFARPARQQSDGGTNNTSPGRRGDNTSGSTASSVRGSLPSIPSPPSGSLSSSRNLPSPGNKSKPQSPSPSTRNFRPVQPRYAALERALAGQRGSNQGSNASSFSDVDISDASVTASALEDAFMSNIRGGASRLSMFARSNLGNRGAQQ